ncbi:FG-GAP-like repeat-containing protein [Streptomyces mangrovi]|uniref:FG-GAP-like repeat-containing protein n=1 Tax=Streptomyces mangrovi TaxID=1206892 RepID=UPI00399D3D56
MKVPRRRSRSVWQARHRRLGAILAAAVAAPLVAVLPAGTASADETVGVGRYTPEEARALEQAADTGEQVEVLSQRTETSQVFATPEGDFVQDSYATPQWIRKSNKLVAVDEDLAKNDDGTFSTKATEVGLTFSGGGDAPLVTLSRHGRSLSLNWPEPLPTPVVDKDTITYPKVLEGVDLQLRARNSGFGHVLVVKDAEAAANPELERINFGFATDGLELRKDQDDNLSAVNPAGQTVFGAPTPVMWDSTQLAGDPTQNAALLQTESDPFERGMGAQQSDLDVELTDDTLSLIPDSAFLSSPETQYPVFIDPSYEAVGSRHSWSIVYKKYPDKSYFNGSNWKNSDGSFGTTDARVGFENHTDGTARSYFRMNTKNLQDDAKVISSSTFRIKNKWSWSCTHRSVELWRTAYLTSSHTWSNQPAKRETLDTISEAKGYSSSCPAGNLAFNATKAAKDSQANNWNTVTFALKATDETDVYGWKKFDAKSAVLSTRYNTRPRVPSGLDTYPVSTNNQYGCGDKAPYQYIGNTDFYLQAKVSDPDGGTVQAKFHLWPTGHNDNGNGLIINKTVSVSSGSVAKIKITKADLTPHLGTANGNFSWKVKASDGSLTSDWNPTLGAPGCRFVFDPNRPATPPGVASAEFPDGDSGWPAGTGSVRTEGTFTLSNGGVTDVARYQYWTSWDTERKDKTPASAGGSVDIKLTPTTTGANMVYVKSYDKANNPSDTRVYLFYANGPTTPDRPGDINGDGNPDMWAIDAAGDLHRFYGAGDGTVTDATAKASNTHWNGVGITHRGDWNDDGYEDLIALRHDVEQNTHTLWLHPNNGYGFACTACTNGVQRQELTVYDPANNHWKDGVKQILAIGDVDGGLDADGDGQEDIPGHPDLLVNDGTFIWLYYGNPDHRLDSYQDPVLLAGPEDPIAGGISTINEVTLGAPGDWNEDGKLDLVVRYDRSDVGGLFVFHGGENDWGDYDISLDNRTRIGWNWGTNHVPLFTTTPDANNNGNSLDFWATSPNSGTLRFLGDHEADTGHTTYTQAATGFETYQAIS